MKKALFFIIFSIIGWTVDAQGGPQQIESLKKLLPDLVAFDSITYSDDTGAAFMMRRVEFLHYFPNGKVDTMTEQAFGFVLNQYKGEVKGSVTTVSRISPSNPMDTLSQLIFYEDGSGRDTALEYLVDLGTGELQLFQRTYTQFDSQDRPIKETAEIDAIGSGTLDTVSTTSYFYNASRLDSILIKIPDSTGVFSRYDYHYTGSFLDSLILSFTDTSFAAFEAKIEPVHNSQNQIFQINTFERDSSGYLLNGAIRFSKRTNSTISLAEMELQQIEIYPNPARDFIFLKNAHGAESFEIFNANGKVLRCGRLTDRVDLRTLESGVYFLRLKTKGKATVRRILKW